MSPIHHDKNSGGNDEGKAHASPNAMKLPVKLGIPAACATVFSRVIRGLGGAQIPSSIRRKGGLASDMIGFIRLSMKLRLIYWWSYRSFDGKKGEYCKIILLVGGSLVNFIVVNVMVMTSLSGHLVSCITSVCKVYAIKRSGDSKTQIVAVIGEYRLYIYM